MHMYFFNHVLALVRTYFQAWFKITSLFGNTFVPAFQA